MIRVQSLPAADSAAFPLPEGLGKREYLPAFTGFASRTGWQLEVEPGRWVVVPSERDNRGLPAVTALLADDRSLRLKIYETRLYSGLPDSAETLSMLGYLFRSEPCSTIADSAGRGTMLLFQPPGDTLEAPRHFIFYAGRDSAHLVILTESRKPLDPSLIGRLPGVSLRFGGAAESPTTPEVSRSFLAALINARGLKALEDSSFALSMDLFRKALDLDTNCAPCLVNIAGLYQYRNENAAGITLMRRYAHLLESSGRLSGILGAMYEAVGNFAQARTWALKALEKEPREVEWLINLSDALWGQGDRVRSKLVLLKPYHEKPTFRLGVYLAATHLGLEEHEKALEVLRQAHGHHAPTPLSAEYTLRAYLGLKRYEEALGFLRGLEDSVSRTSKNLHLKALAEFHLKLYRLASRTVQEALDSDSSNREAQQLATQTAAIIGIRSNHLLKTALSPLRVKSSLPLSRALLQDSAARQAAAGHPFVVLNRQVSFRWLPGTRWKRTQYQLCYVPDGRRLIRFSEITFEMVPGHSRFFVNAFRVYGPDLKLIGQGDPSRYYLTKNHNNTLHPENLLIHIPIEPRQGEFFVELIVTEEAEKPTAEFPYLHYVHAAPYPLLETRYDILRPPPGLLVNTFGEARLDSLPDALAVSFPRGVVTEEGEFSPALDQIASGFSAAPLKTWKDVGEEYLARLRGAGIRPDSAALAVRETAAEIATRQGGDPVRALFRYVRDSILYNNYEFSLHALVPDPPDSTLVRRTSDCKGHALLLMQMLRARGVEARLCLVNLNHTGYVNQPSLHQFNHMIVHVPPGEDSPELFLDPTEKFQPFRPSPLALEGKNVLVIEQGGSRMTTIPELDRPYEHRVEIFHFLDVDPDQRAAGLDSVVMRGKIAAEFRAQLSRWRFTPRRNANLLSWMAESYPGFTDDELLVLNEKDPDLPLVLVLRYRHRFIMQAQMEEFVHYPRLELSFLRYPRAGSRHSPVYVPHQVEVKSQWIYRVARGFRWKSPTLDREFSGRNMHWWLSINQKAPEEIVIRQDWRVEPFFADPEEYAKIQKEWDAILGRAGLRLLISRT